MVILQYCSDKQESARKCDSKFYRKIKTKIMERLSKVSEIIDAFVFIAITLVLWYFYI